MKLRLLRGDTAKNDSYTGSEGEVTADVTNQTIRVHDGTTAGGYIIGTTLSTDTTGTAIELDFRKNTAYEVTLTGTSTVTFTGLREGVLNELVAKFNGINANTVSWPTSVMWMKPDGSFTGDSSQMGFPFSATDWIIFWSNSATGVVYAKVMR